MRGLDHARPRQIRRGIEIEGDAIRLVECAAMRAPGVQFKHAHLHETYQTRKRIRHHVGLGLFRARYIDACDIFAGGLIRVLLIEAFLADTVRAAHQGERPLREVGQHPIGDVVVILRELEFGESHLGIKDARGIREFDARDRVFLRASFIPRWDSPNSSSRNITTTSPNGCCPTSRNGRSPWCAARTVSARNASIKSTRIRPPAKKSHASIYRARKRPRPT